MNNVHNIAEARIPGHRTPEQIRAQLEARLAQMEREAALPSRAMPCAACEWFKPNNDHWKSPEYRNKYRYCAQPLVIGFGKAPTYGLENQDVSLCGPEKALWEPRLTFWQRIIAWFTDIHGRGK